MIKRVLKDIKINYKYYLICIILLVVTFVRLDYYIYSPGSLIDLTDRIEVDNSYHSDGSFNLTYVSSRDGTLLNVLLSYIIPSWDLESVDDSRIEDEDPSEIELRNKIYLKETSFDAIIAAFNEAGLSYKVDKIDLTVADVFNISNTNLKAGDIIKGINGNNVNSFDDYSREISKYKEGEKITINVLRNNKSIDCYSVLQKEEDRIIIGVSLAELKSVTTNPKVEYVFKDNESGSSRGLMCALDIYNKITDYDLTKGRIISGTGVIDEKGKVGAIDGVKYKLIGAVKKKADVFIVPNDNYDEAVKVKNENKYDIKIIKADNLHDVIEELKK